MIDCRKLKKNEYMIVSNGITCIPNLIKIRLLVLKLNHARQILSAQYASSSCTFCKECVSKTIRFCSFTLKATGFWIFAVLGRPGWPKGDAIWKWHDNTACYSTPCGSIQISWVCSLLVVKLLLYWRTKFYVIFIMLNDGILEY
jgi:hypothetical protein